MTRIETPSRNQYNLVLKRILNLTNCPENDGAGAVRAIADELERVEGEGEDCFSRLLEMLDDRIVYTKHITPRQLAILDRGFEKYMEGLIPRGYRLSGRRK